MLSFAEGPNIILSLACILSGTGALSVHSSHCASLSCGEANLDLSSIVSA